MEHEGEDQWVQGWELTGQREVADSILPFEALFMPRRNVVLAKRLDLRTFEIALWSSWRSAAIISWGLA